MLNNIRKGLTQCFISPIFWHLASIWLALSLIMTREMGWIPLLMITAALVLSITDLWNWLRDLAEHGSQDLSGQEPCNTSRVMATTSLSRANIRNGIHVAVGTGHSRMDSLAPIIGLAVIVIMLAWALSGDSNLLVEVPVIILLMVHLGLYVWETNAVGEHACMDTVEYDEDGQILGYIRVRTDGPMQD